MNFFKKALVASAVVASFGASAAKITPSTTILEISKEGIAAGVAVPDNGFNLDVKVEAQTPAASNLKVQFGAGVDLTTAAASITGSVDNTTAGTSSDGDMVITFGTGSFTFDNFAINTKTAGAHYVTFDVSLGQPMNTGAAFNLKFNTGKVAQAATATYTADDGTGVIDTGVGPISVEKDQFTAKVKTPLNGLIQRDDAADFIEDTGTATDSLVLEITNDEGLSRKLTDVDYTAVVSGNFKDLDPADHITANGGHVYSEVTADKVHQAVVANAGAVIPVDGTKGTIDFNYDLSTTNGIDIPVTGDVDVDLSIVATGLTGSLALLTKADGGEWKVDATIINVPYLPVGIDGIQSQIQLANEGGSAVDVIVTANDDKGNQYGPANLNTLAKFADDLPKNAVSKLSQNDLMELLSAPAGAKLSVTFNVDADEGVVNGYAFTQKDGVGRTEVSTSQQRGN